MVATSKEIQKELPTCVRVYKDGTIERLHIDDYTPPSLKPDPKTGISSKDITISVNPNISARLYLPKTTPGVKKFPILVYFHGGCFCIGSAFTSREDRYMKQVVSEANAFVVSVEYRMAPEYELPVAYEDSWIALQWVASHSICEDDVNGGGFGSKDSWIIDHADFDRFFIGGDSAGGNIVHNMAMRAGKSRLKGNVEILGAIMGCPYFWASKPINNEPNEAHYKTFPYKVWEFVFPKSPNGLDNPMINPIGPGAPSLARLGCCRLLVVVAERDELRDRGVWYFDLVKESGWRGELQLFEAKGEGHMFYTRVEKESSLNIIRLFASFITKK